MEQACLVSSWEVEVGDLWSLGQHWIYYKLKTRLDLSVLPVRGEYFLLSLPAAGKAAAAASGTGMEVLSSSAHHWCSGFIATGTLGSSTVVSFKSDSLKVQSFHCGAV